MSALSAAELADMRSAIADLLPDTCNILEVTRTSDGAGGWTDSAGTATGGTAVPCRLDAIQGREQLAGGAIEPFMTYVLSLPYDTVISPSNLIEHSGANYTVKTVNRGQSWKAVVRAELERL